MPGVVQTTRFTQRNDWRIRKGAKVKDNQCVLEDLIRIDFAPLLKQNIYLDIKHRAGKSNYRRASH